MLKRLGIGLLKGVVVGGAVGAGLHFGLGWTAASGLLGYLLAMGVGGTAGVLAGRPPWQHEAWVEGVLKAVVGVGVGALLYWLGSSFAPFDVPFVLPGAKETVPWTDSPLVLAPVVAGIYAALVELDNTDGDAGNGGDKGENAAGEPEEGAKTSSRAKSSKADLDDLLG